MAGDLKPILLTMTLQETPIMDIRTKGIGGDRGEKKAKGHLGNPMRPGSPSVRGN